MSVSCIARRLAICAGLVGVAAGGFSGCGGGSSTPTPSPGPNPTPGTFVAPGTTPFTASDISTRGVCAANAHQNGRARWTVLVYLNAASNLQPDSLFNIAQMASVGTNADLNIVVQWKQTTADNFFGQRNGTNPGIAPPAVVSFVGTRRYLIQKHSQADLNQISPPGSQDAASVPNANTTVLDADRLPDPPTNTLTDQGQPTADMGDYRTLADFVQWGSRTYPADHLAVVVWDHGSAALSIPDKFRSARAGVKGGAQSVTRVSALSGAALATARKRGRALSFDTQTGSQIATADLPKGLMGTAQTIDQLVIDCSLEDTIEVAYEVRKSARVLVATEESPAGTGYPYDAWLGYLQQNTAGPCDSGRNLISDNTKFYQSNTQANVTQAMTDLSRMDALASAVNSFGGSLRTYATSQATLIANARDTAQRFDFQEFKDLYHFANLIRTASGTPNDLATAAANVQTALLGTNGATLISERGAQNNVETFATGLSIYLPDLTNQQNADGAVGYSLQYSNLSFAKAVPNWPAFLQAQKR